MTFDRHILVGDIHGCIEEFDELIKTLSYNKEKDKLILLGDLIDRGPDSVGVIRRAQELRAESVMGNHEHKLVRWLQNPDMNSVSKMRLFYLKFSEQDIRYITKMPSYLKLNKTIAVHAGLKPGIFLENQSKDDLLYLRYLDSKNNFVSFKTVQELGKEQTGVNFWTQLWTGPESVVYGHTVHSYNSPLIEEVSPDVFCYGLDTGCCFGGKLTALILESKEIVQVTSKKTYYHSRL